MAISKFQRQSLTLILVLLLLTLLVWVGNQLHFVRERQRFFSDKRNVLLHDPLVRSSGDIPWIWSALGAEKYSNYIPLPRDRFTEDDLARTKALFPECKVELVSAR